MAGLGHVRGLMGGLLARLPMLVGPSRKGFLGRLTGAPIPPHRELGLEHFYSHAWVLGAGWTDDRPCVPAVEPLANLVFATVALLFALAIRSARICK